MQELKRNPLVRYLLIVAIVAAVGYCIAALLLPEYFALTTNHIQYFSLFFLLVALVALFFNENRLLWICMACSALLSFAVYQTRLKPMPDPPRKQIMPYPKNTTPENGPAPINK